MDRKKEQDLAVLTPELKKKYTPMLGLLQEGTQNWLVLKHLLEHGSISTIVAFFDYGITRLPSRIWELRHNYGINIQITYVSVKSEKGVMKTYGLYTLKEGDGSW